MGTAANQTWGQFCSAYVMQLGPCRRCRSADTDADPCGPSRAVSLSDVALARVLEAFADVQLVVIGMVTNVQRQIGSAFRARRLAVAAAEFPQVTHPFSPVPKP